MQNRRIVPRANTFYTFAVDNEKFTIVPAYVNANGVIVFNSLSRRNYFFTLEEFKELYINNLVDEKEKVPSPREEYDFYENKKVYAVARGRIDNYLTANSKYCKNAVQNYPGAIFKAFDHLYDARDFLYKYNLDDSIGEPLLVRDLSEKERDLFKLFCCLSEEAQDLLIEHAEHYLKEEQKNSSICNSKIL